MAKMGYFLACEEYQTQRAHRAGADGGARPGSRRCGSRTTTTPGSTPRGRARSSGACSAPSPPGTERLRVGTGVTCPILRLHPTIIAQAAATTAAMMPGRFFLGLGTGERLNEHILGDTWPEPAVRLEMLQEAVDVIRTLWAGETASHYGEYYTVENARFYTLPRRRRRSARRPRAGGRARRGRAGGRAASTRTRRPSR